MHNLGIYFNNDNYDYLSRHPEIERFDMPQNYYFRYLPDRLEIHWAIIKQDDGFVNVYFINCYGQVFDKLEFKNVKIARRRLIKCGFDFSTNKHCPATPREPIYIRLCEGKKSAPYSKGNLWKSVKRDRKNPDKYKKSYLKGVNTYNKQIKQSEKERKNFERIRKERELWFDKELGPDYLLILLIIIVIATILIILELIS